MFTGICSADTFPYKIIQNIDSYESSPTDVYVTQSQIGHLNQLTNMFPHLSLMVLSE